MPSLQLVKYRLHRSKPIPYLYLLSILPTTSHPPIPKILLYSKAMWSYRIHTKHIGVNSLEMHCPGSSMGIIGGKEINLFFVHTAESLWLTAESSSFCFTMGFNFKEFSRLLLFLYTINLGRGVEFLEDPTWCSYIGFQGCIL